MSKTKAQIQREFNDFAEKIARLESLKHELDALRTEGFESEVKIIRAKLRDIDAIPSVSRDISELKRKIEKSHQKKAEVCPGLKNKIHHVEKLIMDRRRMACVKQLKKNEIESVKEIPKLEGELHKLRKLFEGHLSSRKVKIDSGVGILVDSKFDEFVNELKAGVSENLRKEESAMKEEESLKLKNDLEKRKEILTRQADEMEEKRRREEASLRADFERRKKELANKVNQTKEERVKQEKMLQEELNNLKRKLSDGYISLKKKKQALDVRLTDMKARLEHEERTLKANLDKQRKEEYNYLEGDFQNRKQLLVKKVYEMRKKKDEEDKLLRKSVEEKKKDFDRKARELEKKKGEEEKKLQMEFAGMKEQLAKKLDSFSGKKEQLAERTRAIEKRKMKEINSLREKLFENLKIERDNMGVDFERKRAELDKKSVEIGKKLEEEESLMKNDFEKRKQLLAMREKQSHHQFQEQIEKMRKVFAQRALEHERVRETEEKAILHNLDDIKRGLAERAKRLIERRKHLSEKEAEMRKGVEAEGKVIRAGLEDKKKELDKKSEEIAHKLQLEKERLQKEFERKTRMILSRASEMDRKRVEGESLMVANFEAKKKELAEKYTNYVRREHENYKRKVSMHLEKEVKSKFNDELRKKVLEIKNQVVKETKQKLLNALTRESERKLEVEKDKTKKEFEADKENVEECLKHEMEERIVGIKDKMHNELIQRVKCEVEAREKELRSKLGKEYHGKLNVEKRILEAEIEKKKRMLEKYAVGRVKDLFK